MRSVHKLLMIFFLFFVTACSHGLLVSSTEDQNNPEIKAGYDQVLKTYEQKNYPQVAQEAASFLEKYPTTIYTKATEYMWAHALEKQEHFFEAAQKYRTLASSRQPSEARIGALAMFRLSYCYESLGEIEKSVTTLFDALKKKQYLAEPVWRATIPARLAVAYYRMENPVKAQKYLQEAEEGVASLRQRKNADFGPSEVAETYYQMGLFSGQQISAENFNVILESFKKGQRFLLHSIEMGDPVWSKEALSATKKAYRDLWNTIQAVPLPSMGGDVQLESKEQWLTQKQLSEDLLVAIDELRAQRLPEVSENEYVRDLFVYLAELEKMSEDLLLAHKEWNPLTPEAEKYESIKLDGRIYDPQEKAPEQPEKTPEDPNL